MLNLQRVFLTILSAVFFIIAITLIIQNLAITVPIQAFTASFEAISLGGAMALVGLLMSLGILLKMWSNIILVRSQHSKANRELERKEVSREEAQEKVKVLETKVATLERALSEALKPGQTPS